MPSYVVVGASRGLGYEWLHTLSADKANVVIGLVRTLATVKEKLVEDEISNVNIVQADMIDHNSLVVAAGQVAELTKGCVDYLIVNGAYIDYRTLGITPTAFTGNENGLREEMKQYLDVNVLGVMFAINAFLPLIRKSTIRKITVLSSEMGDVDFVTKAKISSNVAYGASKAVLNLIVVKYSIELKGEGIIMLALSPGLINTMLKPREYSSALSVEIVMI